MHSKSKIMVFHLKEVVYTILFLFLGIILVTLLVMMFWPDKDTSPTSINVEQAQYIPGVYTSSILVNYTPVDIQVTVDENHINDIRLINLSDSVTVMSPLLAPTMEDLETQILKNQSLEGLTYAEGSEYTYQILLNGIETTLEKAKQPENGE